jgi:hypothetical protein
MEKSAARAPATICPRSLIALASNSVTAVGHRAASRPFPAARGRAGVQTLEVALLLVRLQDSGVVEKSRRVTISRLLGQRRTSQDEMDLHSLFAFGSTLLAISTPFIRHC